MIRTPEELFARAAACKELLDSKFNGSDGKIYLMICGGGGCVASGALKLEEECNRLIEEKGLISVKDDEGNDVDATITFDNTGANTKIAITPKYGLEYQTT